MNKFIMFNSKIFRNTQSYLDKKLKKYNLSSGSVPYLMALKRCEGISQIQISREIGNDRAMSARTINKLIENGFIYKIQDENDSRAYKLYLTEKAKEILPQAHKEVDVLINFLTEDLNEDAQRIVMDSLEKIFQKSKELKKEDNSR